MAGKFPSQRLGCPDPASCPVLYALPELTPVDLAPGRPLFRVYDSTWGHDEYNPGFGDARFSPFDDATTGIRVPTMYLAENPKSALLETVFHEVHHLAGRTVYEADLLGKLLAYLRVPAGAVLGDLRDEELDRLGIARGQIASSVSEHYPCTRRLAVQALSKPQSGSDVQGLIWHSRQAELAGEPAAEVIVLFGSRYDARREAWPLVEPGIRNLYEGSGRLLVDDIADDLGAVVM